jgi:hypothetical protein
VDSRVGKRIFHRPSEWIRGAGGDVRPFFKGSAGALQPIRAMRLVKT